MHGNPIYARPLKELEGIVRNEKKNKDVPKDVLIGIPSWSVGLISTPESFVMQRVLHGLKYYLSDANGQEHVIGNLKEKVKLKYAYDIIVVIEASTDIAGIGGKNHH